MTERIYKFIIYTVLAMTVGGSVFLISTDNVSPFTTQATIHKAIVNISPQVSGVITNVHVVNGQQVNIGDLLFSIDNKSYTLAVRQAEAELHQAKNTNTATLQELNAAKQTLIQHNIEWKNTKIKRNRYVHLLANNFITKQDFDDVDLSENIAKSAISVAHSDVLRLEAELSGVKKSAAIEIAEVKLSRAKLDLTHTNVIAQTTGIISNLQLHSGTYANAGNVLLLIVNDDNTWLTADFNEKGMVHLQTGAKVWITFDAIPGHLFTGTITNQERAIYDAYNLQNQLSEVVNTTRWIREQQKFRTRIAVKNTDKTLFSGSRASVIVKNGDPIIDTISYIWINLVSYFRYIY